LAGAPPRAPDTVPRLAQNVAFERSDATETLPAATLTLPPRLVIASQNESGFERVMVNNRQMMPGLLQSFR
jgi:hypothetical protein